MLGANALPEALQGNTHRKGGEAGGGETITSQF